MKKTVILASLLTVGFVTSCSESFLDVRPQGVAALDQLTNKIGVNTLLIGTYSLLDGIGSGTTDWHAAVSNWVYGGVTSDDAYKGTDAGDQPEISFMERYEGQANLAHMTGKWRHTFDAISRANVVLQAVEQAKDMTDAEKKLVIAEARFLRGYYHFEGKKMWNMIPYIDEKTYSATDPNSTKIANDKNIWPNIEADFKAAADALPETQSQKGRATKFAAMAFLAKAYLFQNKFLEAKPLLDAIVNSNRYKLVDFHDNFRAATNNNAESIFEVQFSVNDGTNGNNGNAGETLNWPYFSGAPGGGCCGFYQPSLNLVNAYKTSANGLPLLDTFNDSDLKTDQGLKANEAYTPDNTTPLDPRLDWTVGRRGIPFLDWGPMPGVTWVRDQNYGGPYTGKKWMYYRGEEGTNTHSTNKRRLANNYRMIRLSHVLLWLAEAEVEVGSLDRARELVNMIRKRAKDSKYVTNADGSPAANYVIDLYPAGSPVFADKASARKAVQFEQRLEFAMEGHRFFDLVRWGIADQVLNKYLETESKKRTYLAGAKFTKGKNEYFPLPIDEITNSSKNGTPTLKQNPGY
ncbi:RagB/SusD family nutrient uptake outer membrane protein [Nibrella saemangeumensis]|uniref:RagB/SusD family nutrient uptake outer membrane protein n=1 Tax=Nibrella saemangeumensis TaxID=1084526 RepID=A0ABP8NL73_9BACT